MIDSRVNTNINTANSRAAAVNKPNPGMIAERIMAKFNLPSVESIKDNPVALQVLRNVLAKTNTSPTPMSAAEGGSVPRKTTIEGQPHALAYINPEEEQMLRKAGGSGQPGPGGVPAYALVNDGTTEQNIDDRSAEGEKSDLDKFLEMLMVKILML